MNSSLQTLDIGDGSLLIQLPASFAWEFEEGGTLCAFPADEPDLVVLRFSVITVHADEGSQASAVDLTDENAAQAAGHGVAPTRLKDRSYFTYDENSDQDGEPIWLRFWQVGYRNHSVIISLCTNRSDKQHPRVGAALQLVPRVIQGLYERDHLSALTPREIAELDQQREIVADALREHYDVYSLPRLRSDLGALQRILDDGHFSSDQRAEWCSLGVVFGDVLAAELGLEWTTCYDEYGVEPALRYANSSVTVFPRTMLLKRVERGESIDLEDLFDGLSEAIDDAVRKCA